MTRLFVLVFLLDKLPIFEAYYHHVFLSFFFKAASANRHAGNFCHLLDGMRDGRGWGRLRSLEKNADGVVVNAARLFYVGTRRGNGARGGHYFSLFGLMRRHRFEDGTVDWSFF
jgi:hypothetical protein